MVLNNAERKLTWFFLENSYFWWNIIVVVVIVIVIVIVIEFISTYPFTWLFIRNITKTVKTIKKIFKKYLIN